MSEVTYVRHEAAEATRQLDAFLHAYEEVYAEPPYREGPSDVAEFIEHYQTHAQRPGMRLVLAHDGDQVAGFTYGYRLSPDTRWWHNLQDVKLPDDFTREDGRRTFVIIELAVRKPWRRRGIAAGLHARLLAGLDVERVTLTMRPEPEAAPAQSAYASWGYRKVGVSHPWDEAPLYDCMLGGLLRLTCTLLRLVLRDIAGQDHPLALVTPCDDLLAALQQPLFGRVPGRLQRHRRRSPTPQQNVAFLDQFLGVGDVAALACGGQALQEVADFG